MKRFALSTQLLIITLSVLVVSSILFGILMFTKLNGMADSQALKNLSTVVTTSKVSWEDTSIGEDFSLNSDVDMSIGYLRLVPNENYEDFSQREIATKIKPQNDENERNNDDHRREDVFANYNWYKSTNYDLILGGEDDGMKIVQAASLMPNTSGTATKDVNGRTIYLAYEVSNGGILFIAFTNSYYAHSLRKSWMFDISYIFAIVLLIAAVIIFIWSKQYTTRLYRLNTHIQTLDKNNYENGYIDNGKDELAELSRSIDDMRQTIKNSEDEKSEMLQNVSHDFKTPISVIVGYAEAIKDGVEGIDKADIIIEQADILKKKVYKLLQYNKLEYLEKDKEFEEVSMKNVISHVLHNYKNLEGINIKTKLDDTTFVGYEENFFTIVDNIMENAKRYAKSLIEINLSKGVLTFYNDGDHIDEKFLNASFKAYEMGAKGQFGLGMSIVKKTLDFFGYEISVSNEEIGVKFTIKKKGIINPNKL